MLCCVRAPGAIRKANIVSELTKNPFLQLQLFSAIDADGGGTVCLIDASCLADVTVMACKCVVGCVLVGEVSLGSPW